MAKTILFIMGHGENSNGTYDPGASGNGYVEAVFLRERLLPYLKKWAKQSARSIQFYERFSAYNNQYLNKVDPAAFEVCELHIDWTPGATGGHVIIHGDYTPDAQDHALAQMIQRFWGCRGGVCFSGRTDLQNVNIARHRGINYRLVEYCFITNVKDMRIFEDNLDGIAKATVEAMTGEKLLAPVTDPVIPKPQPPANDNPDEWTKKVRDDLVAHDIMSDGAWDGPVTKMMVASWLYTAKAKGYFKE